MRQISTVLYIALDDFLDASGAFRLGFDDFSAALDQQNIPTVWLSSRTRLQLDAPRRRLDHTHPFVAEDGCGVFLPQDYFHLRPSGSPSARKRAGVTVRLGRFTCLPIAEQQPAAAEALEALAVESGVAVVPLRSLSPRELAQNLGLRQPEADLARQRDFDELFFFVGANSGEIKGFGELAHSRGCQLRDRGPLCSLAVGASLQRCVRELSALYDRAIHAHVRSVALTVDAPNEQLIASCDRAVRLTNSPEDTPTRKASGRDGVIELPSRADDLCERLVRAIVARP